MVNVGLIEQVDMGALLVNLLKQNKSVLFFLKYLISLPVKLSGSTFLLVPVLLLCTHLLYLMQVYLGWSISSWVSCCSWHLSRNLLTDRSGQIDWHKVVNNIHGLSFYYLYNVYWNSLSWLTLAIYILLFLLIIVTWVLSTLFIYSQ